jgi:hypothetical protein
MSMVRQAIVWSLTNRHDRPDVSVGVERDLELLAADHPNRSLQCCAARPSGTLGILLSAERQFP